MNKDRNIFYSICRSVLKIPFVLFYRPKIINKEYIPKEGPIIICGNHVHLFDQCLPIMSTKRVIHFMAKKEYFDSKFAWFFKLGGCISVNRSINDVNASHSALEVLKNNNCIGIFPEGTRNRTKEMLLPFKKGAASLAKKTNAVIVPYVITGKYKFNGKLTCTFLKPIKVSDKDDVESINNKLRNAMLKELKKHV